MKEENYPTGAFVAFVLLSQNEWDIKNSSTTARQIGT